MFAIRRYAEGDRAAVRALFIAVNRELAPPDLREAFESYITRSLEEEIDRLSDYYAGKQGAFFVAHAGETLAGMFGLEGLGTRAAELRRMYVDASFRKRGLARRMLDHAEHICREMGTPVLTLSTSELQQAALAFKVQTNCSDSKEAGLIGLGFSLAPHTGWYVPVPSDDKAARAILEEFRPVFESDKALKIGHNLKFDLSVLKWHGVSVRGGSDCHHPRRPRRRAARPDQG